MDVLYASDRAISAYTPTGPRYGFHRSGQLTFGVAKVGFTSSPTWQKLAEDSIRKDRKENYTFKLLSTLERGRLAIPLLEMEVREGRHRLSEAAVTELADSRKKLFEEISARLAHNSRKDVILFVHGFNNSFEEAIFRLAQVWHYSGRIGVPVAYTWPAGHGGVFGYTYDRESGEYTIYHLKKFLLALAACPDVERIHLIAHSRGTDVATTALRELHLAYKAAGKDTRNELKLANLILAAPDLDADVFNQRFALEDLHMAARRTTIYFSKEDIALATANFIFGGKRRLGNLTPDDFGPDTRRQLSLLEHFSMIECRVTGYSTSHDYVFAHPAALSDLILVLREGQDPGWDTGRPLEGSKYGGVWAVTNDYPNWTAKRVPNAGP